MKLGIKRYFMKYYFPPIKNGNSHITSEFYSKKILSEKLGTKNKITEQIFNFSKEKKLDPSLILSIYYIENFYRPLWFTFIEYELFKLGLIKNPSIGPFQIRSTNLKNKGRKFLIEDSLNHIEELIIKCKLNTNFCKNNFIKLGLLYNLDKIYGEVIYNNWLVLSNNS